MAVAYFFLKRLERLLSAKRSKKCSTWKKLLEWLGVYFPNKETNSTTRSQSRPGCLKTTRFIIPRTVNKSTAVNIIISFTYITQFLAANVINNFVFISHLHVTYFLNKM